MLSWLALAGLLAMIAGWLALGRCREARYGRKDRS